MKKIVTVFVLMGMVLLNAQAVWAIEKGTMAYKLRRGAINVLSSPLEVFKQADLERRAAKQNNESTPIAFVAGLFKGIAYFTARLGTGLYDMVTFNLERPANYEPIMMPEYILEDWPNKK